MYIRNIITSFILTLSVFSGFAQAPEMISYQAIVRDAGGTLIQNESIGVKISILQTSISGSAVYVETHAPSTDNNGAFSINIGDGTVQSGVFSSIDWGADSYFLKTETDPTGGTSYTVVGTSQLLSVPYALFAKTSGDADRITTLENNSATETYVQNAINGIDIDGDGYSPNTGDCDEHDANRNPGITEILDGIDNNCDGSTDEGLICEDDAFEPNNSKAMASPMGTVTDNLGNSINISNANTTNMGDEDWFSFNAVDQTDAPDDNFMITVKFTDPTTDYEFQVYNSTNTLICSGLSGSADCLLGGTAGVDDSEDFYIRVTPVADGCNDYGLTVSIGL
jgi:hypothetical protein